MKKHDMPWKVSEDQYLVQIEKMEPYALESLQFDYETIVPQSENEKIFFSLLKKYRKAVFDWERYRLYVFQDGNEEQGEIIELDPGIFLDRTGMPEGSTMDVVLGIRMNGIEVKIINMQD